MSKVNYCPYCSRVTCKECGQVIPNAKSFQQFKTAVFSVEDGNIIDREVSIVKENGKYYIMSMHRNEAARKCVDFIKSEISHCIFCGRELKTNDI